MALTRHLALGEEVTEGTGVAPTKIIEVTTLNDRDQKEFETIKVIRTDTPIAKELLRENSLVEFEGPMNYQSVHLLFYLIWGSVDSVTTTTTAHTIPASTGSAARSSVTSECAKDTAALTPTYAGGKLQSFELSLADGTARLSGAIKGRKSTSGNLTSLTAPPNDFAVPSHSSLTFDAGAQEVRNCVLRVEFPTDDPYTHGQAGYNNDQEDADTINVSLTCETLFTVTTEFDKFNAGTEVDAQWALTDGTHSVTLEFDRATITEFSTPIEERNRKVSTLTLETVFNTTATSNLQAVIVNDETGTF